MSDRKRKVAEDGEEIDRKVTSAKATKYAEACIMTEQDDGHSFLQALQEASRAGARALAVGKETLRDVDIRYYSGQETGQDPKVLEARNEFSTSSADLLNLACNVASKVKPAMIYKLPEEVIEVVFKHLDLISLLCCQATCQFWRKVLTRTAARQHVWKQAPAVLEGTLEQTDTMWKAIRERDLDPSELSLSTCGFSSEEKPDHWTYLHLVRQTKLAKDFPKNLQGFKLAGNLKAGEIAFWDCIAGSSHLKRMRWESRGCLESKNTEVLYQVERGDMLCRLEKFSFTSMMRVKIDRGFVDMLSRVKQLYLLYGLGKRHILAILNAAQGSLERATIAGVWGTGNWIGSQPEDNKTTLVMNNLQKFCLRSRCMSGLSIIAPNVRYVRFGCLEVVDWTLLDSCQGCLETLHIQLGGLKTFGRYGQELFHMPELETLILDYRREKTTWRNRSIVVDYRDFSATAFWDVVHGISDRLQANLILPKLRTLDITHDPLLDESAILKYLKMRSLLGQPALEHVRIFLANHCSDSTTNLDALQRSTCDLTYKCFEDWRKEDTKEWFLTTELSYSNGVKWNEIAECRNILKKLCILLSGLGEDERLKQELFNMPLLEALEINFTNLETKSEKRSVAALWKAYSSGTTGDADVALQDIMPRLQKLEIRNDALLDEEVILKMVETRESLGLAAIETVNIFLASKCSRSFARLDALKLTMPRLAYTRFDDWGPAAYVAADTDSEEDESEGDDSNIDETSEEEESESEDDSSE